MNVQYMQCVDVMYTIPKMLEDFSLCCCLLSWLTSKVVMLGALHFQAEVLTGYVNVHDVEFVDHHLFLEIRVDFFEQVHYYLLCFASFHSGILHFEHVFSCEFLQIVFCYDRIFFVEVAEQITDVNHVVYKSVIFTPIAF